MTNENDGKDEKQPQKEVNRVGEAFLWGPALFFSVMIPVWLAPASNLGPIATYFALIFYAIPASAIGFMMGIYYGGPRHANRALLVILCLGLMTIMFILMN